MKEIFVDIEGYRGRYQISNHGRLIGVYDNILKPCIGTHGFRMVTLCSTDGKHTTVLVHRLVAKAFVPNPNNYYDVDHKDFDRLNNCSSNLEWTNDIINNNKKDDNNRNPQARKVLHLETGVIYRSISNAAKTLGYPTMSLYRAIETSYGYMDNHFKYVECVE